MPSPTNTTRFVLLTLLFVLAWNLTSSLVGWGWPTATVIALFEKRHWSVSVCAGICQGF